MTDDRLTGAHARADAPARLVLEEVRDTLADAVDEARDELARLEDEHRIVAEELRRVLSSRGRRWYLAARHHARAPIDLVLHAWRPIAAAARKASSLRERLTGTGSAWHAGRYRATLLRHLPMVDRQTDQPAIADAIRWLGPQDIDGVRRQALFCHPASSVSYRVDLTPGGRLATLCALAPSVWKQNPDGVEFVLSARGEDGSWTRSVTRHVHPRRRPGDRRWRRIALALPAEVAGPAIVTLATRLRNRGGSDSAWALWGEPSVEWRRPAAALLRASRATIRQSGLRGLWSKVSDLTPRDEARTQYRAWLDAHALTADEVARMSAEVSTLARRPIISVVTPVYNTDPKWLAACVESVRRQVYPNWELCLADDASTRPDTVAALRQYEGDPRIRICRLAENGRISAASNAALALASGEFVALLDHDDELTPDALYEVARLLARHPDADFVYSDEDKLDESGARCDPYFKPDWSPEMFRSFMYTNHLAVLRRSLVEEIGGFRVGLEGAQDYDLALRIVERTTRIHHVPKVLYHWRKVQGSAAAETEAKPWALRAARRALEEHVARLGLDAEVQPGAAPGLFRVRHRVHGAPLVTIVIPTDDRMRDVHGRRVHLLANCVRSIVQKTSYPDYELLIVDNGRLQDATPGLLAGAPHRRVTYRYEGDFNFAHKLNFSVRHARGEHLVIFNDDLEVMGSDWLTALLEFSQQPQVGAVGAKLYFPDGRLQHIGIVTGVCGVAAHAFHSQPGSCPGYASSANVIRNYSAVTGAAMMTRKDVFERLGGFDERLRIDFNDVDYCLRLRQAGYRIVYTPYAELYHLEAGTEGPRLQRQEEIDQMRRIWGDAIDRDPYYNPNLTRDFPDHRLRT